MVGVPVPIVTDIRATIPHVYLLISTYTCLCICIDIGCETLGVKLAVVVLSPA